MWSDDNNIKCSETCICVCDYTYMSVRVCVCIIIVRKQTGNSMKMISTVVNENNGLLT